MHYSLFSLLSAATILTPTFLCEVDTDTWPNEYTSMANLFQTVPEIENLTLTFQNPGKVPSWVNGDYFAVGPGRYEWGDSTYKGFLDANAITSKITIRNGGGGSALRFDRKFIKSKTWEWNSEYNDIVVSEFGTYGEPKDLVPHSKRIVESMVQRMSYYNTHISDNTIVKINELYGQMVAFGESPSINILHRDTLETVAHLDINRAMPEGVLLLTQTAHGYFDKDTNTFLNPATVLDLSSPSGIPKPAYIVLKFNNADQVFSLEQLAENPDIILDQIEFSDLIHANEHSQITDDKFQYAQYFHTVLVTQDYLTIPLTNVALEPISCAVTSVGTAHPMGDCYGLDKDLEGILIVLDKRSLQEVGRFRMDYLVAFHEINVFQLESDKDIIVVDCMNAAEGGNPFSIFPLEVINATGTELVEKYYDYMMGTVPAKLTLDLNGEKDEWGLMKATRELMMDGAVDNLEWLNYMNAGSDFPRVRPSDYGKESYDEFYSNGLGAMSPDRVYKTKFSTKERKVWQEVGYYNSEVAVIENPQINGECVILLLATPFEISTETPSAFLVVLDGENLKEVDRAYFPEEVRLPWMAHSTWVDVEQMEEDSNEIPDEEPVEPVTDEIPNSSTTKLFSSVSLLICISLFFSF